MFGVMRVVNVAHGEFYMLGAVLAWWVTSFVSGSPTLGFLAALFVAPLIVGMIALASDRLILKRLHYDPEATIVATIGILYCHSTNHIAHLRPGRKSGGYTFLLSHRVSLVRLLRL